MTWAQKEMESLSLGDKRLNKRAISLLTLLGECPNESIPASCRSWSETKAAYRFFEHEEVNAEKLFEPHKLATLERIKRAPVVLFIQDTSTLNYTGQKQRNDIGPINRDNTRGLFLHPTLAITPERLCLGVVDHYQWFRKQLANQTVKERHRINHTRKTCDKESNRWLEGYSKANSYANQLPGTLIVSVTDREGDIYDIYQEAHQQFNRNPNKSAHWLIRASFNRCLVKEPGQKHDDKLIAGVKKSCSIGELIFELPSSHKRSGRKIRQAVYAKEVTLNNPNRKRKKEGYHPVKTTVVIASELNVPRGEKPVEWVLLTSLPVINFKQASEIISWYLCRWQIELFFKILKSGCKIEKLSLMEGKRFNACLALYMIIAWRILYLTILGRECPEITCECVLDKREWQTAYVVIHKKKPPSKPPKLNEMIKMIASLGGFLNRKHDGEPGSQTIWIGMRNMHEHIKARDAFEQTFGKTYG